MSEEPQKFQGEPLSWNASKSSYLERVLRGWGVAQNMCPRFNRCSKGSYTRHGLNTILYPHIFDTWNKYYQKVFSIFVSKVFFSIKGGIPLLTYVCMYVCLFVVVCPQNGTAALNCTFVCCSLSPKRDFTPCRCCSAQAHLFFSLYFRVSCARNGSVKSQVGQGPLWCIHMNTSRENASHVNTPPKYYKYDPDT